MEALQAARMFRDIARLIEHIPPAWDFLGLKSPNPAPSHASPPPGTLPHGLDAVTDDWEAGIVRSAQGCETILGEIADEWAEKMGLPAPRPQAAARWLAATANVAFGCLDEDTWNATTTEAQRVWGIADRLAGNNPEPTGNTCPNDGAMTIRYIFEDGFADWFMCPACGTVWNPVSYLERVRAVTDEVPDHPDTMITPKDATLLGVPAQTVYSWIRRGQITAYKTERGMCVRLGDVEALTR
ncbi:hypothetical protein ACRQFN_02240 [Actinotignum sp. GS-2025e]|uniref:helix-turn-helix domain-containing protein n=1 Tax=unclassified Actinotignum TaxID=2632702 RepID=UPI003F486531